MSEIKIKHKVKAYSNPSNVHTIKCKFHDILERRENATKIIKYWQCRATITRKRLSFKRIQFKEK
jgi:hypothetical protein